MEVAKHLHGTVLSEIGKKQSIFDIVSSSLSLSLYSIESFSTYKRKQAYFLPIPKKIFRGGGDKDFIKPHKSPALVYDIA